MVVVQSDVQLKNVFQIQTFFSAKELFSDNQSRFLLKFLPPSARDSYYYVTSTNVEENEEKMKNKKKKAGSY